METIITKILFTSYKGFSVILVITTSIYLQLKESFDVINNKILEWMIYGIVIGSVVHFTKIFWKWLGTKHFEYVFYRKGISGSKVPYYILTKPTRRILKRVYDSSRKTKSGIIVNQNYSDKWEKLIGYGNKKQFNN